MNLKLFFQKFMVVAIVSAICYYGCAVFASTYDIFKWSLELKGIFIGIVAILTIVNLLRNE